MLRKLRERMESEQGFTLIELLVVILIIGILAAIALPAFLGQRQKGQDADAKSNARNLVSHVESCFTQEQAYDNCGDTSQDVSSSGIPTGTSGGQAHISGNAGDSYTVVGYSKSGNTFTISKTSGKFNAHDCATKGKAGCPTSGDW